MQILQRVLPEQLHGQLAYLSGPSFAAEVARELPTVVTIAARDDAVAARAQALLSTPRFRCYRTTDVVGERPHDNKPQHTTHLCQPDTSQHHHVKHDLVRPA
jgi:NAD-dependent glycerol-3-phosphate dehydrogenase N-terminus